MNICVFCSASDVGEPYTQAARELASDIAGRGHTLVWGGSNKGTMKVIADAAQEAGGKVIGISVEKLKADARKDADEMVITKDWAERKKTFMERANAIVVLPGGIGTLDEVTEVMEAKKHDYHTLPIVFLNTAGFYDGFKTQLERMEREGFLPKALAHFLAFKTEPLEIVKYIESHVSR